MKVIFLQVERDSQVDNNTVRKIRIKVHFTDNGIEESEVYNENHEYFNRKMYGKFDIVENKESSSANNVLGHVACYGLSPSFGRTSN